MSTSADGQLDSPSVEKPHHFFQVDALKALAIAFVIFDHSRPITIYSITAAPFWERISIPLFLLIMGFNSGLSFKRSGAITLKELYSRSILKKRLKRYFLPFLFLYAGSWLLGIYFNALDFSVYTLIGWLPFWGPGNWFIFVLFTSVFVLPLVYRGFISHPKLTLLLCFLSELALQFVLFAFIPMPIQSYEAGFVAGLIRMNILFYLPAVGMGLWFSEGYDIMEKRNRFMWIALPLSILYMTAYTFFEFRVQIVEGDIIHSLIWGDYTFLLYPYSAFLFLFALEFLPAEPSGRISRFIARIGKSSLHIYYFQIFYMSIMWYLFTYSQEGFGSEIALYIIYYLVNLAVCFMGGLIWYEASRE